MKYGRILLLVCLLLWATPAVAQKYVIGLGCMTSTVCLDEELGNILLEAYRRIGMEVELAPLPMSRDQQEAHDRVIDASAFRTLHGLARNPNLMGVPVPIFNISYVAFRTDKTLAADTWEDLRTLQIGSLRGENISTNTIAKHDIEPYPLRSLDQGFKMLVAGHLEAVVAESTVGRVVADNMGATTYVSPELFGGKVYHAVNKVHAALVPKLARAFGEMFAGGTMKRMLGTYHTLLAYPAGEPAQKAD